MKLFSQIRRSPYQSAGIIFTLTVSFTVLFLFATIILFVTSLVSYIKTQPQVSVYFMKTTPQSTIFKLREDILKTGKVRDVVYISQEKALQFYRQITKNDPSLTDIASSESLPESLEIYAKQPEFLKELAAYAKKQQGVESVEYQEDLIGNLIKVTNGVSLALFAFLIAQLIIVFFLQFMVTAFQIVRKKDEIEILRLLGASRNYVTRPLSQLAIFLTGVSVVISAAFISLLYLAVYPFLKDFLYGMPSLSLFSIGPVAVTIWPLSISYLLVLSLVALATGACITLFSTWFAARKYII